MWKNEIEISGVIESLNKNKNALYLFLTTAAVTGMKLSVSDLEFVSRAGPRRSAGKEPRPLVVCFCRREARDFL